MQNDVAFINADEGQYAPAKQTGYKQEASVIPGLEYKQGNIEAEATKYRNAEAIPVAVNSIVKTENSSAINNAIKKFLELYPAGASVNTVIGEIYITRKSIKNSLAHGFSQKKLDAVLTLVDGMREASYLGSLHDIDNNNVENHYFAYKVIYNGEENIVFCRIKENAGRLKQLYIHEVVSVQTIKNWGATVDSRTPIDSGAVSRRALNETSIPRGLALYGSILKQFLDVVNNKPTNPSGVIDKGMISPQQDGSYIISLFKGADASTVIHETGHYFVDTMINEALADIENVQLNKDVEKLLAYAGIDADTWRNGTVDDKRAAHEKLAEAFESYIMEGKAPSSGLRKAFRRFANWLSAIYQKIKRSENAAELTPEVREVFDHIIVDVYLFFFFNMSVIVEPAPKINVATSDNTASIISNVIYCSAGTYQIFAKNTPAISAIGKQMNTGNPQNRDNEKMIKAILLS